MSAKATVFIIDIDLSTVIESEEDRINLWNDYLRLKKHEKDGCFFKWSLKNNYQFKLAKDGEKTNKFLTIDMLEDKYKGISKKLKRGDLIENLNESGYRSQGVYCFDGTDIVGQNFKFDDYGTPSTSFKLIKEFPPGYWDEPIVNNDYEEGDSRFYWHFDKAYAYIHLNEYENHNEEENGISFMYNNKRYLIKTDIYEKITMHEEFYVGLLKENDGGYDYILTCDL